MWARSFIKHYSIFSIFLFDAINMFEVKTLCHSVQSNNTPDWYQFILYLDRCLLLINMCECIIRYVYILIEYCTFAPKRPRPVYKKYLTLKMTLGVWSWCMVGFEVWTPVIIYMFTFFLRAMRTGFSSVEKYVIWNM